MDIIHSRDLVGIVNHTLTRVDGRLVNHGRRVAYLVRSLLPFLGTYGKDEERNFFIVAVLHDIGAYKTDEIDNMLQFESRDVWNHSIYGCLFLRHFSPLGDLADIVLYHHLNYKKLAQADCAHKEIVMLLHLADRVDIYTQATGRFDEAAFRSLYEGKTFEKEQIDIMMRAQRQTGLIDRLIDGTCLDQVAQWENELCFSETEIKQYLRMIVYAIDFRSEFTVTHTINTVRISVEIARRAGLSAEMCERIYYGALLHDLGKISIPLEILESPGRLSREEMEVMKTHVVITREIIGGVVDAEVCEIAVRHHEKLDGTGYPDGLRAEELTLPQRIVAVADIVSALTGKRSYKDSFDKERIFTILTDMRNRGQLCPRVTDVVLKDYDDILENAAKNGEEALHIYNGMKEEYIHYYRILDSGLPVCRV